MSQMVEEVTIERTFAAPRGDVFKAFTDPEQLKQWYGPKYFTTPVVEIDLRPGGKVRLDMQGPDGSMYPGGGEIHEVVEPEKLVMTTTAFEDEHGEPMLAVHNTFTFEEVDGGTKLTLHAVVTKATPEMAQALSGMEQGWSESFDKLDARLEAA